MTRKRSIVVKTEYHQTNSASLHLSVVKLYMCCKKEPSKCDLFVFFCSVGSTLVQVTIVWLQISLINNNHLEKEFKDLIDNACYNDKSIYQLSKMKGLMQDIKTINGIQAGFDFIILILAIGTCKWCCHCLAKCGEGPNALHGFMSQWVDLALCFVNVIFVLPIYEGFEWINHRDSLCYYSGSTQ
eukprot:1076251_1